MRLIRSRQCVSMAAALCMLMSATLMAQPGEPSAATVPAVTAKVTYVQDYAYVNFDEHGVPRSQQHTLNVSLRLTKTTAFDFLACTGLDVLDATTDQQQRLISRTSVGHAMLADRLRRAAHGQTSEASNTIDLNVALSPAMRSASRIDRLKLRIHVAVSASDPVAVKVGKIRDIEGKLLKLEGLEQFGFRFKGEYNRNVAMHFPPALAQHISTVVFHDDAGTVLNQGGGGYGGSDDEYQISFGGVHADKASATLFVHPKVRTHTFEVELTNIPLPIAPIAGGQGVGGQEEVVIQIDGGPTTPSER